MGFRTRGSCAVHDVSVPKTFDKDYSGTFPVVETGEVAIFSWRHWVHRVVAAHTFKGILKVGKRPGVVD